MRSRVVTLMTQWKPKCLLPSWETMNFGGPHNTMEAGWSRWKPDGHDGSRMVTVRGNSGIKPLAYIQIPALQFLSSACILFEVPIHVLEVPVSVYLFKNKYTVSAITSSQSKVTHCNTLQHIIRWVKAPRLHSNPIATVCIILRSIPLADSEKLFYLRCLFVYSKCPLQCIHRQVFETPISFESRVFLEN